MPIAVPAGGSRGKRSTVTGRRHVRIGAAAEEQGYGCKPALERGAEQGRAVTSKHCIHTCAALEESVDRLQIAGFGGLIENLVKRGRNPGSGLAVLGAWTIVRPQSRGPSVARFSARLRPW